MSDQKRFVLTEEHLILLRAANIGWDDGEFGAPAIDCKRPYGNSGVLGDMAELLGVEMSPDGELDRDTQDWLLKLHAETRTSLQILVRCAQIETGVFVASKYRQDWERSTDA